MTTTYYNLRRTFYKEHKRVEQRSWDEIDKFLNLHQIKFSGFDLPKPIFTLDEINFPDYILDELRMQGITRPTAIQSMTWPALYSGRDVMCIGLPTHSRVISYVCPALVFIKQQEPAIRKAGPLVLIVTQTKEVAKEILTQSQMFMQQSLCSFCCLFDDENINTQAHQLREHEPDILIGNYHRLCELLDNNMVNLKNVSYLVMDDFYRNRSARLSDEIKRVVNETRSDRQTAIFSRIVPSGLQKSNGDEFQNDAVFICIGNDDIHVVHKELAQQIHICTMAEKKKKLQDIISEISEKEKNFKILVYANGFKKIRITEKIIKELGIDTFAYERTNVGRRRRAMKEKVYYNFNATPNSVLVASDVVSSRVELPDMNYIINADFPVNLSLYLNRMRMSNIKKYISIFIAEDARHADRLIYVLNECRQAVPPILYRISEAYINSGKDVDRMPSLQEINDGLTKPVEKPIPKPLPPTVGSEATNESTSSTSLLPIEPSESPDDSIASSSSSSSTFTAALIKTSTTITTPTQSPIYSTPANTNPVKRFKSFHSSFPPPKNSTSTYNRFQPPVSFAHHQQYQSLPPQVAPSSVQQIHYAISPATRHPAAAALYSYPTNQAPVYSYQTNQQPPVAYYTTNGYTTTLHQPYYAYPTTTPPATIAQTNILMQQSRPHAPLSQQQQQQTPSSYTNEVYQHHQQQQQSMIKSEPMEPVLDSQMLSQPPPHQSSYFTNPISFKQEPIETTSLATNSNNTAPLNNTSNTSKRDDDSNAFSIVTHLLKDKQILSQLEKVAQFQSFRNQTTNGSLYQGNWNFPTSSQSNTSS